MRSLPLVLALLPGIAAAKPIGWGAAGAGSVEISGPVEVPLYVGPLTNGLPAVWVNTAPNADGISQNAFMTIDVAGGWTTITEGDAAQLGAKVKHGRRVVWVTPKPGKKFLNHFQLDIAEKTYDYAVIPELHVGDLVLKNVRARVGGGRSLGLGTLDELGVAVLPSKGVVKFVPADQAEALLAEVGTPVDATRSPSKRWMEDGSRVTGNGVSLAIPGNVGGKEGLVRLRTDKATTLVTSELETWTRKVDGVDQVMTAPVVGGATLATVWANEAGPIVSIDGAVVASIGYDALHAADVAVAPSLDKIAIQAVSAPKQVDPRPKSEEAAREGFAVAEKQAGDKPEEKATVEGYDPGLPATMGRESSFAGDLLAVGKTAEAIEHYRKAVAVAGDNCAPYHALGKALLSTGNAQEALPLLEKAGGLWDRWYAQDVDTRDRIAAKKGAADATFLLPQSSSCFTAWGDAAEARLAMGDHAGVAEIYAHHVDLDADLPLAYGLSLVAQGKAAAANGPIRQAGDMGASEEATRTALALATGGAVAERQIERIAFSGDLSFGRIGIVDAARRSGGDAAALAAAEALVKADALSVEARLVLALEQRRQGMADGAAATLGPIDPLLVAYGQRWQNDSRPVAYAAVAQALKGDAAGAKSALDAATASYGPTSVLVVAQAIVANVAGDTAAADAALATLRATDPLDALGWLDL